MIGEFGTLHKLNTVSVIDSDNMECDPIIRIQV